MTQKTTLKPRSFSVRSACPNPSRTPLTRRKAIMNLRKNTTNGLNSCGREVDWKPVDSCL